ncbi:MAG: hypothetical protein E6199_15815, partial [Mixta calida]|nr:hypothetical protein [Mixta calida]
DLPIGRPEALAGFQLMLIYRRWGISPRPENKRIYYSAKRQVRQRSIAAYAYPFSATAILGLSFS